jgi:hypothetical protein
MKIDYKRKQQILSLVLGLLCLLWFFLGAFVKENPHWTDYGWLFIALLHLGVYFYRRKYSYLAIENGRITVNGPLGKSMDLSEIKRIKKFAGDYILKADNKELSFSTQFIDPNLLTRLNSELEKLNVEWR